MAAENVTEEAPSVSDLGTSSWRPIFEAVLRQILDEYEGQEAKIRDGMEQGMRKLFEKPYAIELGKLDGCPAVDTETARRVFFSPQLRDMIYYVAAFRRETSAAAERRFQILKFKLLSVFYTVHRKDGAQMDRFMHYGGLLSLTALLSEDNPVIKSQAVELLMEFLSPMMEFPEATTSRQSHLHHEVFECLRSESFWQGLANIISEPAEVFPRSHAHSVRILAGAVGWLRPAVANTMPPAKPMPDMTKVIVSLQEFLDGSVRVPPDIRGLTEELLEELQGNVVIRADPLAGDELDIAREQLFCQEAQDREEAAHAWHAFKQLGNQAFKASLYWPAEASYSMALTCGGSMVPPHERSLIESNRALVLMRAGHHSQAAEAAARALEHNPRNGKAAYRRSQALLEIVPMSKTSLQDAVVAAELAARLEPKDVKVTELVVKAKDLLAKFVQSDEHTSEPQTQNESGCALDAMD